MTSQPSRLTKSRVEALLLAAGRGLDEWEAEILDDLGTGDAEHAGYLRALDEQRADAAAAMDILRRRYLPTEAPAPVATDTALFTTEGES